MNNPIKDDWHSNREWVSQLIATICMSDEFEALKQELEDLYSELGDQGARLLAFKDALYSLLAQEEIDLGRMQMPGQNQYF